MKTQKKIKAWAIVTKPDGIFIDCKEHRDWAENRQRETVDCVIVPCTIIYSLPNKTPLKVTPHNIKEVIRKVRKALTKSPFPKKVGKGSKRR